MEILRRTIDWMRHSNERSREDFRETLLTESPEQLIGREWLLRRQSSEDRWFIALGTAETVAAAGYMFLLFTKGINLVDVLGPSSIGPLLLATGVMSYRESRQRLEIVRGVI